ncbi:hypothetical protein LXA43DRAFT_1135999 [Ganoderma leucocontextum]|nr:hypothetical protein LXA43DRAFT_1135999 [Ganoderma leucocontextum]
MSVLTTRPNTSPMIPPSHVAIPVGMFVWVLTLRGGKPVIYLFPPRTIPDATVSASLVPQWSFSHPDGTLVEKDTNLELSYLFQEDDSNASLPPSSPLSAADVRVEHFDPAYPTLDYYDSPTAVLLPFAQLLPYLDVALKKLSLHTCAGTTPSPTGFRSPSSRFGSFLRRRTNTRREVDIQPAPDVVTRVFMLFRGVSAEDAEDPTWSAARARVGEVDWVKVVGVEAGGLGRESIQGFGMGCDGSFVTVF